MNFQRPSLQQAVNSGNLNAIRAMLADGADVNAANESGQTPIIVAIVKGHYQVVDLLLSWGADPSLRDNTGLNAIEWAQRKGRMELVQLLGKTGRANKTSIKTSSQPIKPPQEEKPTPTASGDVEDQRSQTSEAERSRRFIAGLRQRLEEKATRDATNIASQADATEQLTNERLEIRPITNQIAVNDVMPQSEAAAQEEAAPKTSTRKRCPKCNRIYDSELLAYCAYHEVQLVDADKPQETPSVPEESPPKPIPLLWILVAAALAIGSFAGFLLINSLFVKQTDETPARAAPTPVPNQRGLPVLGTQLDGKAETLPEAEVPPNTVSEPTTIIVRVRIDREGRVYSASSTANDRILRDAAIDAARKATFSVKKLRRRGAAGTITYTFR